MYLNQIRKHFCNNILKYYYFSYIEFSQITQSSSLHIPCLTVQREMYSRKVWGFGCEGNQIENVKRNSYF